MKYKIIRNYLYGWLIANVIWFLGTHVNPGNLNTVDQSTSSEFIIFITTWLFQALVFGTLFLFIDRFIKGKVTFFRLQVYGVLLQILLAFILTPFIFFLLKQFDVIESNISFNAFTKDIKGIGYAFIYALIVNFTINLFSFIDLALGKGNLLKMIKGTFYTPRESEQMFMFLDLKGSTQLAEQLGHIKYSEFIQDCFYYLAIVDDYRAEVYQYVGDEVVLTWSIDNGMENNNCINAFFAFKEELIKNDAYYKSKYGVTPMFKAGINLGIITITEVGELKREIAYHGDTVNTAARLQGECNRLGEELIVSENVFKAFKNDQTYFSFKLQGDVLLRGKGKQTKMYSVSKK